MCLRRRKSAVVRMQAALDARVRRFAEFGDPSGVLEPAALAEADRLWAAAQPADRDPGGVPLDVVTVLAHLHWSRYQVLPQGLDQDDLRKALGMFSLVGDRAPERVPEEAMRLILSTLHALSAGDARKLAEEGARLFRGYRRTGRLEVLDAAVTAWQDSLAATQPGDPDLPVILSGLGAAMASRFVRVGDAADLDAAIDAEQRAVEISPPGYPNLAITLSDLGASLLTRFARTSDPADLDASIDAGQRAADLTTPGDPDLAITLSNLARSLRARFDLANDPADLRAATDAEQRAASLAALDHGRGAAVLSNLGGPRGGRLERVGDALADDHRGESMAGRKERRGARDDDDIARARQFTDELGQAMGIEHPFSHEPQTASVDFARVKLLVKRYPEIAEDFVEVHCLNARMNEDKGLLLSALPVALALSSVGDDTSALQNLYDSARQLGAEDELHDIAGHVHPDAA